MILVDATKLQAGSIDEDYFTMKLLSHLSELDDDPKNGWAHAARGADLQQGRPVRGVLGRPGRVRQAACARLVRICQQRFHRHQFFAAGVAGACATRAVRATDEQTVPLRIEPRGIIEPFEWLVENLRS